ncbi:MAG TPA: HU family DNA-binding protein [Actinopolymorphaceae bacterium]|nr:HU family DNA-binding protein [Actinopolymorphaceae bacterium]
MNKSQLVEALSTRFEGNKKDAQLALESVIDVITRAVTSGERVAITGFGVFEKIDRPARMVRNPRTGERKRAKKTSVPKFRAGAELKAVVAGAKKLPRLAAAKKATSTRTTAKAVTKKAPAKKAATRTPAKRAATKVAAKKTTAKKTTARKTTAKKTTAKRTPARRAAKR